MSKPYTTYEEQIEILRNKGLVIEDEGEVIDKLKECGYFGLISGYKRPFKDRTGRYKLHTTINDIYALYTFDSELRVLFLRYILRIENHIKSLLSYYFCEKYGESQSNYLNVNNYEYENNQEAINFLVSKLQLAIDEADSHIYLKHQKKSHGNIALWALIRVLTLGNVSKMYSLLKPEVKCKISKEFKGINEGQLERMIDILSRFRNVCAHSERLYDYKYNKGEIDNTEIHKKLEIKKKKGHYIQGKKDLFAVVVVFKYMLSQNEFDNFVDEMSKLIMKLLKETNVLQELQVLKLMGFPDGGCGLKMNVVFNL